jgi:hypothetical protein
MVRATNSASWFYINIPHGKWRLLVRPYRIFRPLPFSKLLATLGLVGYSVRAVLSPKFR